MGNKYINSCDPQILKLMCDKINIPFDKILNNKVYIGAQYIFNKVPSCSFWNKVMEDGNKLYTLLSKYKCSNNDIQIWTAGMWSILFNLVNEDYLITQDASMNFSWASDNISTWEKNKIFHCAGVVNKVSGHFYKGEYTKYTPFFQDLSYVNSTSCSSIYKDLILEYKKVRNIN
jgi:hypothetical protein